MINPVNARRMFWIVMFAKMVNMVSTLVGKIVDMKSKIMNRLKQKQAINH